MSLSCDFETRSTVDLRKSGVHKYASDPATEILCLCYAFEGEGVQLWLPGQPVPARIRQWVRAGGEMRAHNAQFERVMWHYILTPRYYFPEPALEQWHCTAAEAAAMALPRALGKVAAVLGLAEQKDDTGYKMMLKMCKPKRKSPEGAPVWNEDPADFAILYSYCKQDVRTEQAVAARLRRLDAQERAVYILDQKINDRGVMVDLPLVEAAKKLVDRGMREANAEIEKLTEGAVSAVTQTKRIVAWIAEDKVDNLRKDTVRDLLKEEQPEDVARVLTLRQEAGKTSVGKLDAFQACVQPDGVIRGNLLYHGATTGRWSGQRVQWQNLPRPEINDVESYIPDVLAGQYAKIAASHNPVRVVSSLLRSMMRARPGHRFLSGDYSQIEARIVCWIAGADYGDAEYERMAGVIYGRPWEEIKAAYKAGDVEATQQRTIGKNTVLGCGFGMGPDTYVEQAHKQSGIVVPMEIAERAVEAYRTLKWQVPEFWRDSNNAAMEAVREPGSIVSCGIDGKIRFVVKGPYLWCILPSGRPLAYGKPRLEQHTIEKKNTDGTISTFTRLGLSYVGLHNGVWGKRRTYGGHLVENIVQATARDCMAEAMLRVEDAGYPLVLSIHDELLAEPQDGFGTLEEYLSLMKQRPAWGQTCPIAVEGWTGPRYKK